MQGITIYKENENITIEQFVLEHKNLVKKIALYIKRRLPSHVELDDLLQSGIVGLLEAKKTYQPDMNATFETFASIRIRGSIIDSLRKNSWVNRDTILSMKKISKAINLIEQKHQRPATTEEIIEELNISLEEYYKLSQDINILHIARLEDHQNDENLSSDLSNPEGILYKENLKNNLKIVLDKLPKREKIVLSLYYLEELTFKEIGEVLELTEARICQIHTQAIARVRSRMEYSPPNK